MSQVSVPTSDPLLRRSAALPLPWSSSEMNFVPDSSVVADIIPSGNFGERRNGREPDMIVLHYTGMLDGKLAVHRLTTVGTEVSAHYIVLEDGRIIQSVPESRRSWHAGASSWAGEADI